MGKYYWPNFGLVICLLVAASLPTRTDAQPAADQVKFLPGVQGPLSSRQYSGYLKATGSIRLHYWFVESQGNPAVDPVLLWLNGGPSCSSLDGYLTELGPYWVNSDGKTLSANDYSWTKVASVLFLEAPAGVGFSYADSPDYTTDDDKTAANNLLALEDFFRLFPGFAKNDFYITGESYAGIYVPTLAVRVLRSKANINLKGIAIGNGLLDYQFSASSRYEYAYYHAMIDDSIWKKLQDNCCSKDGSCRYVDSTNKECVEAQAQVDHFAQHVGINPYYVTADCQDPVASRGSGLTMLSLLSRIKTNASRSLQLGSAFLPCVATAPAVTYLNQPEVRTALHIPSHVTQKWTVCNPPVAANYTTQYRSVREQILALLPARRVLLYNGGADFLCNFLGDQQFAASLGLPELAGRRPWTYGGQVAGFVQDYKRLTFMTVKNSGHMVPGVTPGPALQMISNFLKNKPQ